MEFFIFGTVWFWLLLTGAAFLIIWFLESALNNSRDNGGGIFSTITIIGAVAIYYFLGSKDDVLNFFIFIKDHPLMSITRVGIYIGIGLVWSIFKWYFFLKNKMEYLTAKFETEHTPNWSAVSYNDFPKAKNNKSRIISWMSYWPFSALWTLINEPVKKTFRFIYSKVESIYEKMAEKIFEDLKKKIQTNNTKSK